MQVLLCSINLTGSIIQLIFSALMQVLHQQALTMPGSLQNCNNSHLQYNLHQYKKLVLCCVLSK